MVNHKQSSNELLAVITQTSPIFNILIFLGDGYDSKGSLQWRSSGSDTLPLCFGQFPSPYMKISCMKNNLKLSKTFWCNKIGKINFVHVIIHHHVLQWFFPFILTAILTNRSINVPELALIALIQTIKKSCIFQVYFIIVFTRFINSLIQQH